MAFKDGVVIGPVTINTSGVANTAIGATSNSGTISIGNTSSGAITVDCGTAGITVGTTGNAHASVFGSTNSTSATTVQSGSGALNVTATNSALTVNSGMGTIGFSNDSAATTVNIATGGAAKTVTLGSTNSTSVTNIQSGSGGINIPAFTAGAIVTNSSGVLAPANGTATHVLTSNGAGVSPTFQAPPAAGSGGFVLLQTLTASNSASLAFTSTYITSTYYHYFILFNNISSDSGALYFQMYLSADNGSTYESTGYAYSQNYHASTSATITGSGGSGLSYFTLANMTGFTSFALLNGYLFANTIGFVPNNFAYDGITVYQDATFYHHAFLSGSGQAITVNNIKFQFDSGNIVAGTISLYGITK